MYAWLWYHLPGPTWLKTALTIVATAAIVYLLFEHVFPWITTNMQNSAVS
jgi:hypothetical protein